MSNLLNYFFGYDIDLYLFINSIYQKNIFNEPINSQLNPSLHCFLIKYIMLSKYYIKSEKSYDINFKENDIHNNFTDFIINTALFHRSIDKPVSTNSDLINIRKMLNSYVIYILNKSINLNKNINYDRINTFLLTNIFGISLTDLNINSKSTQFECINTLFILMSYSINNIDTLSFNELVKFPIYDTIDKKYKISIIKIKDIIQNIIGNSDNINDSLSDIYFNTFFNQSVLIPIITNIKNILLKNKVENIDNIINKLLNDIHNKLVYIFFDYIKQLYIDIGGLNYIKSLIQLKNIDILRNILTTVNTSLLKNILITQIENNLYDIILKIINLHKYNVSQSESSKQLIHNIFANWHNLDYDSKSFYNQQLHLLYTNETGIEEIINLNNISSYDLNKCRLNLAKKSIGSSETMFCWTLPFLPTNEINNLWYTNNKGQIVSINHSQLSYDTIKKIYNCVYNNIPCKIGNIILDIPSNFKKSNYLFNVNPNLIIREYLKCNESYNNIQSNSTYIDSIKYLFKKQKDTKYSNMTGGNNNKYKAFIGKTLINASSMPINYITESDIKLPYIYNILQSGGNNSFEEITKEKREKGELSSKIYAGLFINVITELKNAGVPINTTDEQSIISDLKNLEKIELRLENLWKMLRSLADLVKLFGGHPEKDIMPFKLSHIKKYEEVINELLKNKNDLQSCIKNNINDGQTIQNDIIKKYGTLLIDSSKV